MGGVPDQEALRVFIGASLPMREIAETLSALAPLRSREDVEWISDPTVKTPTHILSWDRGQKRAGVLNGNSIGSQPIWLDAPHPQCRGEISTHGRSKATLIPLLVPIAAEVARSIQFSNGGVKEAVAVVDSAALADYVLLGRYTDKNQIEYAWAQPAYDGRRAASVSMRKPGRAADAGTAARTSDANKNGSAWTVCTAGDLNR